MSWFSNALHQQWDSYGDIPVPSSSSGTSSSQYTETSMMSQSESLSVTRSDGPPATGPTPKRKSFSSCDACVSVLKLCHQKCWQSTAFIVLIWITFVFHLRQRMRKIKCNKAKDATACEGCLSKNIACTFVFRKEKSDKTKRVQQAKQAFGSTDDSLDRIHSQQSSSSVRSTATLEVQPVRLPGLLHTFKDQIWLIVPTTNVRRKLAAAAIIGRGSSI